MPLRRTPPPSTSPRLEPAPETSLACELSAPITHADTGSNQNSCDVGLSPRLQHFGSEPNLNILRMNVTDRKKRKFEGDDFSNFMSTIKEMFDTLSTEQNKRFQDLLGSVNSLREQNADLTKSVETMSHKYDEFLTRIKTLEDAKKEDRKYINLLEQKIENLERKTRSSGIEIRNVPKCKPDKPETKTELCELVKIMGRKLNIDINDSDIRDVYRVTAKDSSKPIITEFASVIVKEKILTAVKSFNKTKEKGEKLNTSHFNISGPVRPVFIAETLTQKSQKLFYLARMFAKEYGFAFCWTSRGVIYLRKDVNLSQIKIENDVDLEKLKNCI